MQVAAISEAKELPRDLDVISVVFTPEATHVDLRSRSIEKVWRVWFAGAEGHRVLDEGDLLEFWPECSAPNGCIFKVLSGGWFEGIRPGQRGPEVYHLPRGSDLAPSALLTSNVGSRR